MNVVFLRLGILGALAVGACATPATPSVPEVPPTYLEVVAERVLAQVGLEIYRVRHNPAGCACPTWEIRLGPVWHRVILEADEDEEVLLKLAAKVAAARESGRVETHLLQGELQRGVEVCGRGAAVLTLEPRAYGEPEGEEEASPPGETPVVPGADAP